MCGASLEPPQNAGNGNHPAEASRPQPPIPAEATAPYNDRMPDLPEEWLLDGVGIVPRRAQAGPLPGSRPPAVTPLQPAPSLGWQEDRGAHEESSVDEPIFNAPPPSSVEPVVRHARNEAKGFTLLDLDSSGPSDDSGSYLTEYDYDDDPGSGMRRAILVVVALALGAWMTVLWTRNDTWRGNAQAAWKMVQNEIDSAGRPSTALPVPAAIANPASANPAATPAASTAANSPSTAPATAPAPPSATPASSGADASSSHATSGSASAEKPESDKSAAAASESAKADTKTDPKIDAKVAKDARNAKDAKSVKQDAASEDTRADAGKRSAKGRRERSLSDDSDERAAADDALVTRAQGLLYGRSGSRSCPMAVTLLQKAAADGNPKASSQLGAMYATGHCVRTDRAKAYQFMSRAAQAEPNNASLKRTCDILWRDMSPYERRKFLE